MDHLKCKTVGCSRPSETRVGWCKPCRRHDSYLRNKEKENAHAAAWQKANPDRVAAIRRRRAQAKSDQMKAYRKANATEIRAKHRVYDAAHADQRRAWREANSSHLAQAKRAWARANAERERLRKAAAYAADPSRRADLRRAWAEANPERVREISRQHRAKRRAQERGSRVSPADYRSIIAEFGMVCHLCGGDISSMEDLDFDHVVPLALGGAHALDNLKPSHRSCNRSKGARLI